MLLCNKEVKLAPYVDEAVTLVGIPEGSVRVYEPGTEISLYAGGGGTTGGGTESVRSVGQVPVKVELVDGGSYPSGTTRYWQTTLVDGSAVEVDGQIWACTTGVTAAIKAIRVARQQKCVVNATWLVEHDPGNVYRQAELRQAEKALEALLGLRPER